MRLQSLQFLAVLTLISLTTADEDRPNSLGIPYFQAVTPAYPTEKPDTARLDVIIKVPYDAIQFLRKKDLFEAQYELAVSVRDLDGRQIAEKIWQHSVRSSEFRKTISSASFEQQSQSFLLKAQPYKCFIELTDMDTHKSGRETITVDLSRFGERVVMSDLLLVDPTVRTDNFPEGLPLIPPQISDADSVFHLAYEVRSPSGEYTLTKRIISVDGEILSEEKDSTKGEASIATRLLEGRRLEAARNKFKIELEVSYADNRSSASLVVDVKWRGLTTHVLDLKAAIDQIRYIATRDESKKIQRATGERQEELFKEFWKQRDPTPGTPTNELMDEFYRRVEYSNKKFGTFQDGWKTDMGMIFILFGPPDDVEINLFARDGRSYQKWHYYPINRSFVFVDYDGFGDYELIQPYYSRYGSSRR